MYRESIATVVIARRFPRLDPFMSESDPVSVRCESVILVSDFHNFSCSLIVNKESSSYDTC
ncbi:hypothetical protein Hanom_Chr01g00002651 [Helianthus anomalus]